MEIAELADESGTETVCAEADLAGFDIEGLERLE